MTDYASRELCQEVYEATGWLGTHSVWIKDAERPEPPLLHDYHNYECPAYTIGFLLDKLSCRTMWFRYFEEDDKWYVSNKIHQEEVSADTPADSLVKLALELHKQGLLK